MGYMLNTCQSMVVFGDVMTIASVPSGWCLFSRRKENEISYHPSISYIGGTDR